MFDQTFDKKKKKLFRIVTKAKRVIFALAKIFLKKIHLKFEVKYT